MFGIAHNLSNTVFDTEHYSLYLSSVEKILDMSGRVINAYKYDAFGKTTYREERVRNLFKYAGQLGVIADEELVEIYMMRSRHYDAKHGRFISIDPIGE